MPAINDKRIQATQTRKQQGFILLPVVLALTLIAAVAYLMNVEGAMNVNSLGKEIESSEARFIAQAGMNQMLWQANKANCTGYANLTNTAFGTDRYSATITPTSGTPVSISVTGTHANGASYSIRRDRVKVYKPSTTVTQKMGDKAADRDSTLDATKPTSNSGTGHVFVSATATGPQKNALLYFDVSSIPAGNKVISAQLELFPYYISSPGGAASVHRVIQSWVEGTRNGGGIADGATWNSTDGTQAWTTPGGSYIAAPVASQSVAPPSSQWVSWPIENLVDGWVNGAYPNLGLLLKGSGTFSAEFADKGAMALDRPRLTLIYACECGKTCANPDQTVTLNPAADAFIDSQATSKNFGASQSLLITFVKVDDQKRIALRFDTTGIPTGALIQSAKLRLNVSNVNSATTDPKTVSAYALTQTWVEGTKAGSGTADGATWNKRNSSTNWTTAGGTYRTPSVAMAVVETSGISPPPGSFSTGWLTWNLTALTQEWVDGITVNNGVLMISTVVDEQSMDSKEKAGSTKPQLVITYTPP